MRESGCHEKGGMSCLNCHSMHASDPDDQLRRDRPGPTACIECHREAKYTTSIAEHTHHAPASSGSDCRNCHMPHTSYALFKAIRNHQISVPRVAALGAGGAPNACNLCHLDRSLAWTQDWLGKWYGRAPVTLPADSRDISATADWLLRGHAAQRIIAAWHLGWEPARRTGGGRWLVPLLATAISDDYGPVRFVAGRSLRAQEGMSGIELDFIAEESVRRAHTRRILDAESGRMPMGPGRVERLEQADGRPDLLRINGLLDRQDRRSVTVKE